MSYNDHDKDMHDVLIQASPTMRKLLLREHALHDQVMAAFRDKDDQLASQLKKKIMQLQLVIIDVATDEEKNRTSERGKP